MELTQIKEAIKESDRETVEELLEDYNEDIILAALEAGYPISDIKDGYQGQWGSDEEFVQQLLEDCGDIPANLPVCIHIDWEATARDYMTDYTESNGHYFRDI